ncbi:transglutaminase domain-containing protein [Sediminibacter sp. Hel_I_10]|uniref:transglutaminase domain-containing protein n=1 Tax=Sediminibacter sp. Hel_I_10 TaxID=1392490 RepID=UPI00055A5248|nr:transglutaminase domain-containing protein [Sediminibacter sp. Hel_I_10]
MAYQLTNNLPTEAEKFRSIYTWVCNNIRGDMRQQNIVSRKRKTYQNDESEYLKWNEEYKKTAFKKLLKYKKTMCTGYVYLIKELCFLANIHCEIIDGYGRTVATNVDSLEVANHSWNAVFLNNKWYLCDATWSSGYLRNGSTFVKDYNDGYFLADPELFGSNHYPLQTKWLLEASISPSTFVKAPLIYDDAFQHQIIPATSTAFNVGTSINSDIIFKYRTLKPINPKHIQLVSYSHQGEKNLKIKNVISENGLLSFTYAFDHKGTYDVHLKVDKDMISTHIIHVSK